MSTPPSFTDQSEVLQPGDPEQAYYNVKNQIIVSVHYGQRKLLLSELEFLIRHWDTQKIPRARMLYIGAAPGYHLTLLRELFPQLSLILYDTALFTIDEGPEVRIVKELMTTTNIPEELINQPDLFFVSDIRTPPEDPEKRDLAQKVVSDMELQKLILETLQPAAALLKMRLTYPPVRRPQISEEARRKVEGQNYLDGVTYFQPWRGRFSTECRLMPQRDPNTGRYLQANWDTRAYQDINFYLNFNLRRETFRYLNPLTGRDEPIDPPSLLQDFDSCFEAVTLRNYLFKMTGRQEIDPREVIALSRWITRRLQEEHDKFRSMLPQVSREQIVKPIDLVSLREEIRSGKPLKFRPKPSTHGELPRAPPLATS